MKQDVNMLNIYSLKQDIDMLIIVTSDKNDKIQHIIICAYLISTYQ